MYLISPADGTVVGVKKDEHSGYVCVSIFINFFDAHRQVAPADGKVLSITRVEGNALPAFLAQSKKNTFVQTVFEPKSGGGQVVVRQMVGFFVRRIINSLEVGQDVRRGEVFGHIVFGSRCEIEFSSKDFDLSGGIKPQARVRAGVDVIATKV